MNIVCALMLLFVPEEHAFYMLCVLCEQLTPDYYVKAMIGTIVDQRIFEGNLTYPVIPIYHNTNNNN